MAKNKYPQDTVIILDYMGPNGKFKYREVLRRNGVLYTRDGGHKEVQGHPGVYLAFVSYRKKDAERIGDCYEQLVDEAPSFFIEALKGGLSVKKVLKENLISL